MNIPQLLAIATMTVAGCATTTPAISELSPVPRERIASVPATGATPASITIARDRSFAGSAVNYRLLVDGVLVAQIATGEYLHLQIPAGERVLEVRPNNTWGAAGDAATLQVSPGGRYAFRINSDAGLIKLLRTADESAFATR